MEYMALKVGFDIINFDKVYLILCKAVIDV